MILAIIITVFSYISSDPMFLERVFGSEELAERMEQYSNQEQGVFRRSTFVKYANYFYPFFIIPETVSLYRPQSAPSFGHP